MDDADKKKKVLVIKKPAKSRRWILWLVGGLAAIVIIAELLVIFLSH